MSISTFRKEILTSKGVGLVLIAESITYTITTVHYSKYVSGSDRLESKNHDVMLKLNKPVYKTTRYLMLITVSN